MVQNELNLPETPTLDSVTVVLESLTADRRLINHVLRFIDQQAREIESLQTADHVGYLKHPKPEVDKRITSEVQALKHFIDTEDDEVKVVLVIEDNEENAELIKTIVEKAGYRAVLAYSAYEGIELARQVMPDIILCDFHLPGMHGLDAVRSIKEIDRLDAVPVIMLTADLNHAKDSAEVGVNEYLIKPIRKNMLLARMERILFPD